MGIAEEAASGFLFRCYFIVDNGKCYSVRKKRKAKEGRIKIKRGKKRKEKRGK